MNAKDLIETGCLIATASDSFFSEGIRKVTDGEWSHIACCLGKHSIVEARGDFPYRSVTSDSVDGLLKRSDRAILLIPKCPVSELKKISENWLIAQVGKSYDYFNTLVIQSLRLIGFKQFAQKRYKSASKKWMCAELGQAYANKYRPMFFKDFPGTSLNPQEIVDSGLYEIIELKQPNTTTTWKQ